MFLMHFFYCKAWSVNSKNVGFLLNEIIVFGSFVVGFEKDLL